MPVARLRLFVVIVFLWIFPLQRPAEAYSLLTHEQLIDLTWKTSIVPLLLSRYPTLTPQELEHARAYAYGECLIQDIGYYPFGDQNFSNLTHYVRTGDFIVNLFRNAGNADELAFAVGALSHYIGDTIGHSEATNLAVPVEFPKLEAKYGSVVNYAEGRGSMSRRNLHLISVRFRIIISPQSTICGMWAWRFLLSSLRWLSIRPMALLRIFRERGVAASTSGLTASQFIPLFRESLTPSRFCIGDMNRREPTTAEAVAMEKEIARVAAENDWDAYRHKPGIGTYSLAGLLFILPKVGALKLVAVRARLRRRRNSILSAWRIRRPSFAEFLRGLLRLQRNGPARRALQPQMSTRIRRLLHR